MKAALITEEQIEAICNLLDGVIIASPPSLIDHALAVVRSLKVQEPVAYGHQDSHGDITDCLKNKSIDKCRDNAIDYDIPLYAGETK